MDMPVLLADFIQFMRKSQPCGIIKKKQKTWTRKKSKKPNGRHSGESRNPVISID
jgi:hypothetical protein